MSKANEEASVKRSPWWKSIGPALITGNSYVDVAASRTSAYRLTAVNGIGRIRARRLS